jgi:hypothetical protein
VERADLWLLRTGLQSNHLIGRDRRPLHLARRQCSVGQKLFLESLLARSRLGEAALTAYA